FRHLRPSLQPVNFGEHARDRWEHLLTFLGPSRQSPTGLHALGLSCCSGRRLVYRASLRSCRVRERSNVRRLLSQACEPEPDILPGRRDWGSTSCESAPFRHPSWVIGLPALPDASIPDNLGQLKVP